MPTQPAAQSEQSPDQHAGAESVQEVGPGPARLNALAQLLADLIDRHCRAIAAMQRADHHLVEAARVLERVVALRTRLDGQRIN
jgi:hypothetical protein